MEKCSEIIENLQWGPLLLDVIWYGSPTNELICTRRNSIRNLVVAWLNT